MKSLKKSLANLILTLKLDNSWNVKPNGRSALQAFFWLKAKKMLHLPKCYHDTTASS